MVVRRKQQFLAKIETSEGVSSSPGASDAAQVYEPDFSDSVEQQNRVPAGATLSRDFTPLGRSSRTFTFETDFRGSGDTTIPVDEPESGRFLKASAYGLGTLSRVTVGAVTGTGFQLGEQVTQSSGAVIGVVVGAFTSAGVLTDQLTQSGGWLAVAVLAGTFTAAATTGSSSGSTSIASAVAAYPGIVYQPTSRKLVRVTTGAWSASPPVAVGEVLDVLNGLGQVIGGVQIIVDNGTMTDMDVTLLWGTMDDGDDLRAAAGDTATISAPPVQVSTPSLTINHNLDGRRRDGLGVRGDFNCAASVGEALTFSWTMTGDLGPRQDATQITTTGLSAIRAPRLQGAICAYGIGDELRRLPTKAIGLNNGGTVAPNLDGNRDGGSTGSNVTDRDMTATMTVDDVLSAFDWEQARDDADAVRVAWLLGRTAGQIVGIVVPNGQVTEVVPSDSDGIATFDVTVAPRRIRESGDDEVYFVQL